MCACCERLKSNLNTVFRLLEETRRPIDGIEMAICKTCNEKIKKSGSTTIVEYLYKPKKVEASKVKKK